MIVEAMPLECVRKGDRIWFADRFRLVLESHSYLGDPTVEPCPQWVIETQKSEDDWDWSTYDTYGPQPNDDYEGPEMIVPQDCRDRLELLDRFETRRVDTNDKIELVDPLTGLPFRWFVNVYELNQAFGGPEEGGWWVTTGEYKYGYPCVSFDQASDIRDEVNEELQHDFVASDDDHRFCATCDATYSAHNYTSVNYSGGYLAAQIDKHQGKDWPETFPRYS